MKWAERLPGGDTGPVLSTAKRSQASLGVGATVTAVVLWGFGPNLAKLMDVGGLTVAFHRMWLAAVVLVLILAVRRQRPAAGDLRPSLLAGLLFGLNACFFFNAVKLTSVADATLIASLSPVMILVVAGPLFGEKVSIGDALWTLGSIAGVALVVLGSSSTAAWSLQGDLLAVASLFAWTAYFLMSKWARGFVGALDFQAGVAIGATPVVGVALWLFGGGDAAWTGGDMVLLVLLVAGPGIGGHLLMAWAHKYVDVSASSVIVVAQPVGATAVAAVLVDEPISLLQAAGGVIVIASILAVVRRKQAVERDLGFESVEAV